MEDPTLLIVESITYETGVDEQAQYHPNGVVTGHGTSASGPAGVQGGVARALFSRKRRRGKELVERT